MGNKTGKLSFQQQRQLLLLQGESLRLQLMLDVMETRQTLQPVRLVWQILSPRFLTLCTAFFPAKRRGVKRLLCIGAVLYTLFRKKT